MADVSVGRGGNAGSDRGQLVLVAAVGIAALVLTLALLLNAAVYTENLATRGGGSDQAGAAVDARVVAVETVTDLRERSNAEAWPEGEFEASVERWNAVAAGHAARTGATTHVTVTGTTYGPTRIVQADETRVLTDRSGADSWTLLSDVPGGAVTEWELRVARDSLVTYDPLVDQTGNAFAVTVTATASDDSTTTTHLYAYRNGTSVLLVDGVGTTCDTVADADGFVALDVLAGTLEGDGGSVACPALDALDTADPTLTYTVSVERGTAGAGTYSLLVDQSVATVNADGAFNTDGTSPYVTPTIEDVTVEVTYTTRGIRYHSGTVDVEEVGS